jgi:hypothetical protein
VNPIIRETKHKTKQKNYTFSIFRVFVSMPITMAIHSTGDGGAILTWTLSTCMSVMLWPALDGELGAYVKPTQPRQIRSNQREYRNTQKNNREEEDEEEDEEK